MPSNRQKYLTAKTLSMYSSLSPKFLPENPRVQFGSRNLECVDQCGSRYRFKHVINHHQSGIYLQRMPWINFNTRPLRKRLCSRTLLIPWIVLVSEYCTNSHNPWIIYTAWRHRQWTTCLCSYLHRKTEFGYFPSVLESHWMSSTVQPNALFDANWNFSLLFFFSILINTPCLHWNEIWFCYFSVPVDAKRMKRSTVIQVWLNHICDHFPFPFRSIEQLERNWPIETR